MANEWKALVDIVAVSLTPGANGRFEVYLDGEKIFDKKEENNAFPELSRVRKLKQVIQAKLDAIPAAADD
jgi:predicted Rdx family selenoprotein